MSNSKFDGKLEKLVSALKSSLREVNAIYLMSFLNQKLIHSIQLPLPKTELPDGFSQKFHYIHGLIVSQKISTKKTLKTKDEVKDKIFTLTEEIFEFYIKLWMSRPSLDGSEDTEKVNQYGAGLFTFLESLHQSKLGSSEQFIDFALNRFQSFDERFFIPDVGLSTQQCIDISLLILERTAKKYEDCIKHFADAMQPMVDLWQKFRNGEITLDESRDVVSKDHSFSQMSETLKVNTDKFMNSFIISPEDLTDKFKESTLSAYFAHFSVVPGKTNYNFRYPTDVNELDFNLFIRLDDGRYYIPEVINLPRKLPLALERKLSNSAFSASYLKHRDTLTQKNVVSTIKAIFPNESIFEEAYYGFAKPLEFEADLLISFQRTLILCEVKAKELRDPLYTEGNISKLKSDFKASIQKAYEQAIRTRNYILSQENAIFVNKKRRLLCTLNKKDYDEFLIMVVTAESFGGLACNLSFLLEKPDADPYPLAISQFDLELLLTRINSPESFIDYFKQRIQLHGSIMGSDELDFAGYYIKYGNLDFKDRLKGSSTVFLGGDFSHIFDEDWFKAHGFEIEETELHDPYFSVIERHGNQVFLGVEGIPETFETINLSDNRPVKKEARMKGRDRNSPCPCGSGRKYKKCCGKPDWLS